MPASYSPLDPGCQQAICNLPPPPATYRLPPYRLPHLHFHQYCCLLCLHTPCCYCQGMLMPPPPPLLLPGQAHAWQPESEGEQQLIPGF